MQGNVLVIDDERKYYHVIKERLYGNSNQYNIHYSEDLASLSSKIHSLDIDLVIIDLNLDKEKKTFSGTEAIKKIRREFPRISIAVLSGFSDIPRIVQTVKNGADEYFFKGDWDLHSSAFKSELQKLIATKKENDLNTKLLFEDSSGLFPLNLSLKKEVSLAKKTKQNILLESELGIGKNSFISSLLIQKISIRLVEYDVNLINYQKKDLLDLLRLEASKLQSQSLSDTSILLHLKKVESLNLKNQHLLLEMIKTGCFIKTSQKHYLQFILSIDRRAQELIKNKKLLPELYGLLRHIILPPLRENKKELSRIITKWLGRNGYSELVLDDDVYDRLFNYDFPGNYSELYKLLQKAIETHKNSYQSRYSEKPLKLESFPEGWIPR